MSGLPSAFFTNLLGLGVSFQTSHVELMPMAHLALSGADVRGPDGQSQSASGIGADAGLRVAVGWFDALVGGLYISAYQGVSTLTLDAHFSGTTQAYHVVTREAFSELGVGYKLALGDHLRLDLFTSLLHVGVRPGSTDLVEVTSYPTLGVGLDWLPGRLSSRN